MQNFGQVQPASSTRSPCSQGALPGARRDPAGGACYHDTGQEEEPYGEGESHQETILGYQGADYNYSTQFDLASITDKMAEMDDENEPPKIKLGDASCAAPFTSKLANVSAGMFVTRRFVKFARLTAF